MSSDEKIHILAAAWKTAGDALSFKVEAPYFCKDAEGVENIYPAYLPHFGGPNGMVIGLLESPDCEGSQRLKSFAESKGFYFSFINWEVYQRYDEETFREALSDWDFFGPKQLQPKWNFEDRRWRLPKQS